jgi:hypothetical protein
MRKRARLLLQDAARITGAVAAVPDPLGSTLPEAPTVPQQINAAVSRLAGVTDYNAVADTKVGMQNEALRLRLAALELVVSAQQAVVDALAKGYDKQSAQVQVLTAQLLLAQQNSQALQATQAAAELRLSAVEAKANLVASATEANRLDIISLKAADVLLQAQDSKDVAAIATAQATATQAKADAATAQKKADDDAAAVLVAQAQAKAAQDTATAAQQAVTALANRFRSAVVTVPSMVLGGSIDVVATFPAFADNAFVAIAEPAGLTLLGLDATEVTTARTATSATFRIKNVLGLAIAAGGTLTVFAYHP